MAELEGWAGGDRRTGRDRRRARPKRTGFFIHKVDGAIVEVPCRALAMVNFEEKFKTGIGRGLADLPASRASWLAWECERLYSGHAVPGFEDWIKDLEAVEEWEEPLPLTERASVSGSPG